MRTLRPILGFVWAVASVVLAVSLYAGYRAAPGLSPFVLETIRVEGVERTPPGDVVEAVGLPTGSSLLGADVDGIRKRLEGLPWVSRARVMRQVPSTLRIVIDEWQPRYLVRLDRLYYLTAEGHVVRAALDQGLDYPVVTGFTWAQLEGGGTLRQALQRLLQVLEARELMDGVSEIHADPDAGMTFYTTDGEGTGIHLGFGDFDSKIETLARLRRSLERRNRFAYAVNLSYPDRIIAKLTPAGERGHP